jgi:hypothetical protein
VVTYIVTTVQILSGETPLVQDVANVCRTGDHSLVRLHSFRTTLLTPSMNIFRNGHKKQLRGGGGFY